MRTPSITSRVGIVFVAATLVALGVPGSRAEAGRRGSRVHLELDLASNDLMPAARGRVGLVLRKASEGKFEVVAKRLERRATYEVVLHGIKIGEFKASNGGNGKLRFSSRAHRRSRVLGFEPRGRPITVNDKAGRPVLSGSLPELESDDVACCVPRGTGNGDEAEGDGDGEDECESMTADECSAAGGTVADAPSCLPDPCAPSADQTIVCCLPCGDPPPCELRTEADCFADDGMMAAADTCEPNPCAPTAPLVQCCLEGGACDLRSAQACADDGGSDMGAGTCDPDPCS